MKHCTCAFAAIRSIFKRFVSHGDGGAVVPLPLESLLSLLSGVTSSTLPILDFLLPNVSRLERPI